ncbi:MAG: cell division protein SepF [Eubacteriales bacterium]|nr:cell division protein SepF [Eubacteriales bacterium]MDY3332763.1 cell division protein SepF [Gallibacter sp.]
MGVIDKFKDLVGVGDEYDEEYEDSYSEEEYVEPRQSSRTQRTSVKHNVVPMPTSNAGEMMKLMVVEPNGFDESPKLVDELKRRKPVILNLEKIDAETARKIFDFLSGATYALNGNIQKIANDIFIFAPENVDIYANSVSEPSRESNLTFDNDDWR